MSCGAKCSVYSRVTGYYRPIENWNRGKQEEFKDRKTYDFKQALVNAEAREREAANAEVIKYPAVSLM